jgi:hypothetical protein
MKKSGTPHVQSEPPSSPFAKLDLPDAPDFISRRSPIPFERMLALLEEYRRWFPMTESQREQRLKRKCDVEFVL